MYSLVTLIVEEKSFRSTRGPHPGTSVVLYIHVESAWVTKTGATCPEEIRRLNAHKVSQVTLYVSGDPCGVPKATMPTRSPRCIPVFVW